MKDYELQIKVKNGPMLAAMRRAGCETAADLARLTEIRPGRVGEYLNLRVAPVSVSPSGEWRWRSDVERISKALRVLPEELFPAHHLTKALPKNTVVIEISLDEVARLASPDDLDEVVFLEERKKLIAGALATLPDRARHVVERHFLDGATFREIGEEMGISLERARQIEAKALRRLAHPNAWAAIGKRTA